MKPRFSLLKIIVLMLYVPLCFGFRKLPLGNQWSITAADPTIWIKMCETTSFDENDMPSDDYLSTVDKTNFTAILQSIIDDYNNQGTSFVRLALYPDDPDNPPTPATGQSTFTRTAAETRTVDVCFSTQTFTGGYAQQIIEEQKVVGCKIQLSKETRKKVLSFVRTLTHELGHCLGLDHAHETQHAIMSYHTNAHRLRSDDIMGLSYLYPTNADYGQEQPTLGFSCSPQN